MQQVNKNISYLQNILQQYHKINNDDDRKIFIMSRNIPENAIDFMKGKSSKFFDFLKESIKKKFEKGTNANDIIDDYSSYHIFPKNVMKYIILNKEYITFDKKQNDCKIKHNKTEELSDSDEDDNSVDSNDTCDDNNSDNESDNLSELNDDTDDTEIIHDPLNENELYEKMNLRKKQEVFFKFLRKNQTNAINKMIEQKFVSGIHNQIMGAGKTWLILLTIKCHLEKTIRDKGNINKLYVLACKHQEILRKMFFDNEGKLCDKKKLDWKQNGIIDLDQFDIIKCVSDKNDDEKTKFSQKELEKKINNIKRPTILIINTEFMRRRLSSKNISNKNTHLCLLDECHDISGTNIYSTIRDIKYNGKVHFIGFSATPLRGKSDKKLVDIFSTNMNVNAVNNKLNVISTYSLLDGIRDEIILPFKFHYVEVEDTKGKNIGKTNEDITKKILKEILPELPYQKVIGWCRTIDQMIKWANFFIMNFPSLKVYVTSHADDVHKNNYNTNFDEFCETEGKCILLCVHRHREGSDIQNLDCGLYLDAVKNRSILVAMQTSGRIIRFDLKKLKTRGVIVDLFVSDGEKSNSLLTVKKIIDYYKEIANLEVNEESREQYRELLRLLDDTEFDEKEHLIKIKIDDNNKHDIHLKIKLIQKEDDWQNIKELMKKEIAKQTNVSKEDQFDHIIDTLKKMKIFHKTCDFWDEYSRLENKARLGLPENLYQEFKEFFDKKSWYEILGINTSEWLQTPEEVKEFLEEKGYKNMNEYSYMNYVKKHKELPPNPKEFFKSHKFTSIEKEFNPKKKLFKMGFV